MPQSSFTQMEVIVNNGYGLVYVCREAVPAEYRLHIEQETLSRVELEPRKLRIHGREVMTPRSIGSFSDPGVTYNYSGFTETTQTEWSPWIDWLRQYVQNYAKATGFPEGKYNYVLINQYQDGRQYIGWHSDDESSLTPDMPIVSVSLGATRDFQLRPVKHYQEILGKETITVPLREGDILIMGGTTQKYYAHSVPKRLRVKEPRLNYTFRSIA